MRGKFSLWSALIGALSILGILYQNYRLASMYVAATGKTKALFGITEISQLDNKLYLGIASVIALGLALFALWKKENKANTFLAIVLSSTSIILLFIRLWPYMV